MWDFLDGFMMWGSGVGVYYVCLFMMLVAPETKEWRKKLVFPNLFLLFLIVNPPLYQLIWSKIFGITLHRINMCFPIGFVIAFVLAGMWSKAKGRFEKLCAVVGILLIMGMSYNTMWEDANWKQNSMGLSADVIEAADYVLGDKESVRIMTSDPDFNLFRQYTGKIQMLYGENISQDKMDGRSNASEAALLLYSLMEEKNPDLSAIFPVAYEEKVDYILVNTKNHEAAGGESGEGYRYDTTIGIYDIYKIQGDME